MNISRFVFIVLATLTPLTLASCDSALWHPTLVQPVAEVAAPPPTPAEVIPLGHKFQRARLTVPVETS